MRGRCGTVTGGRGRSGDRDSRRPCDRGSRLRRGRSPTRREGGKESVRGWEKEGEKERKREQLPRRFGRRRAWSRRSIFPDFSARGSRASEREGERSARSSQPRRARCIGTPAAGPLIVVLVLLLVASRHPEDDDGSGVSNSRRTHVRLERLDRVRARRACTEKRSDRGAWV